MIESPMQWEEHAKKVIELPVFGTRRFFIRRIYGSSMNGYR